MIKKLFAALLAVTLLCGTAGATSYIYNGKDGLDWDNAYIINSFEDMEALAQYAGDGKFYKLNADITLTAKPRWASSRFNGYLDGQNHTIDYTGVSDMPALFYEVSVPAHAENPAIQKLKVKGTVATTSYSYLGGIIRYLGSGIIDSCTFTGSIRTTINNVGGIVGYISQGTIKNCTVSGTFRASSNIGGIIGNMYSSYSSSSALSAIENCTVLSGTSIAASGGSNTRAGGIAGYMLQGKISGCTSYAALSDAQYKGGVLGFIGDGNQINNIADNKYANADKPIGNREGESGVNNTKITAPGTGGNNNSNNNTDDSTGTDSNNTGNDTADGNDSTNDSTGSGDTTNTNNGTDGSNNNDGSTGDNDNDNDNETDSSSSDSDDSGCNSGIPALMLACAGLLKFRKR